MQLRHRGPVSTAKRPSAAKRLAVRAVAEPATKAPASGAADAPAVAAPAIGAGPKRAAAPEHFINVIPRSAWDNGIPPVMVRGARQTRRLATHNRGAAAAAPAPEQLALRPPARARPRAHPARRNPTWRPLPSSPPQGAHLMASGVVAPISTSKGAGEGVDEHQFQYPAPDANIQVGPSVAC